MPLSSIQRFLRLESAGGLVLAAAALAAVFTANSPWAASYAALQELPLGGTLAGLDLRKPLLLWVNDGLMAIFFLLVGLEIKREFLAGELSRFDQAMLPSVAAVAGFAVPALIYAAFNHGDPAAAHGWAIPAATDIAFALGTLNLLGRRVPLGLKVFMTTVATVDDILAIIVMALFYSADFSTPALMLAGAGFAGLIVANRLGVRSLAPYLLGGAAIWVCVLKSGAHATLTGLLVAAAIPMAGGPGGSPGQRLEESIHPWVAFGVLPAFAYFNAGFSFAGISPAQVLGPLPLGIAIGLIVGKTSGIFATVWLMVRLGWARRPAGAGWMPILGVAMIGGIGFTMSLFIGALAFGEDASQYPDLVRLGVLGGSVLSGAAGYLVLRRSLPLPRGTA